MGQSTWGQRKMTIFGNWKLSKNDNFDEYMAKIGVSWALRKAGALASSSTKISDEGGSVRIATTSTVKSSNNLFKIDGETDETTMDGRKVKTTYKWQGDALCGTQKWDGKESTLKWALEGANLVCVSPFTTW